MAVTRMGTRLPRTSAKTSVPAVARAVSSQAMAMGCFTVGPTVPLVTRPTARPSASTFIAVRSQFLCWDLVGPSGQA